MRQRLLFIKESSKMLPRIINSRLSKLPMTKKTDIEEITYQSDSKEFSIRAFREADIDTIVECFARHNWPKPRRSFEIYFAEQKAGTRQIWVAFKKDQLAGYVTLSWRSKYKPFLAQNIPEIMDLNVLPPYRKLGIGSKLIKTAEDYAAKHVSIIGIGVGLYDGYGDAQKIYVKHGYIPDGRGPTYCYSPLHYGQSVIVDDDLVMWFTKLLPKKTQ